MSKYKHSEETKRKISNSKKGVPNSEEHNKNIGLGQLGKPHTEEHKLNISKGLVGRKFSDEHRRNISISRIGMKLSETHKRNIGSGCLGEKNGNWKGGITPDVMKIRGSPEMAIWRKFVFERDDYTCQECGESVSGKLCAHHIKSFKDYPRLRFQASNGLTMCKGCHTEYHNEYGWR